MQEMGIQGRCEYVFQEATKSQLSKATARHASSSTDACSQIVKGEMPPKLHQIKDALIELSVGFSN